MALEKELALAIEFKKAPKELQDAALAHYASIKALVKLKVQLVEVNAELTKAEKASLETEKIFRSVLSAWDPVKEDV